MLMKTVIDGTQSFAVGFRGASSRVINTAMYGENMIQDSASP